MKYDTYSNYKASDIGWIMDFPAHWELKRLKYVANRSEVKIEAEKDNPLPYIGLEQVEPWTGRLVKLDDDLVPTGVSNYFTAGDTLFGKLRPYLAKACNVDFDGLCSSELLVLRGKNYDRKFLLYQLLSHGFINLVDSSTYGSKMPRASWDFIGICELPLPPLDEQQTIARFLDTKTAQIDELIAKKRQLIAKLKEKRQALIARTVTRGLPPEAAKAAGLESNPNPEMKDSGVDFLGVVPKTWNVVRLKHVLNAKKGAIKTGPFGSQLHGSEMLESEIKVFNQRTVIDRDISSGDNYISLEKFEELKSFEVFPGDLLVTTRGTIGRCMVVPDGAEKGILHPCLMRLQLNKIHITDRYLELLIEESGYVIDQLRLMSNATTIEVIYSESLKEVWLAVPPLNEQCKIIEYLDRGASKLDALVERTVLAIARLTEYRQALITSAVTGKIDVRATA